MASKSNLPRDAHLNIKIAHLNVRSLKFRENFILIKDTIQSIGFDIFTISETRLDSSVPDAFVYTPGYTIFRQGRGPHKAGGGLFFLERYFESGARRNPFFSGQQWFSAIMA